MEYIESINGLYGGMLFTLMKEMKLSAAHQRINEFTMTLMELGYSRQELIDQITVLLKEEE